VPLLTLHTTADWVVPVENERAFAAIAAGPLLRQLYIRRAGHCAFTDAEMLTALDMLFARIHHGRWPSAAPAALNAAARRLGPAYAGFAASRAVPLKAPPAFIDHAFRLNGGYSSVTRMNAYAVTRFDQRPTPTR